MARALSDALRTLARLHGVQTAYLDITGRRRAASPEALLAVLRALGAPLERAEDAADAARARRRAWWARPCEPVIVAWDGRATLDLRLPAARADGRWSLQLEFEGGGTSRTEPDPARLEPVRRADVDGARHVVRRCEIAETLPPGVHRLTVEAGGAVAEARVISAPLRAPVPPMLDRAWGIFLPLYALRSARDWGLGDFTDLGALLEWTAGLGGRALGTLPLLAAFLDEPFDPSPYAPVSRLFWNELYVDPTRTPEWARSPEARARTESAAGRSELERLRAAPEVDHRAAAALKRQALEALARVLFEQGGARRAAFDRFAAEHPALEDYARFRAVAEARREPWPAWPERLRRGELREGDYLEDARRTHLYAQWVADEQLGAAARAADGAVLYLDLPLGAHPDGYDVWREQSRFVRAAAAGAPPDTFFREGQNWGFPPLHPDRIRDDGYRHYAAVLRHSLRHAGILRIDHVMAWHRLFWVPHGFDAKEGVYVRYRPEEFHAIAALESHRRGALLVGEDLGTVPAAVREAMARHRVHRMYVAQYSFVPDPRDPIGPVPADSLAGLNTHDMPTFAAFWEGLDLVDRRALGWLRDGEAEAEARERARLRKALLSFLRRAGRLAPGAPADARAVAVACLEHLAAGPARVVLVNLEDLWAETRPQNLPGSGPERPNWRRKARHSIEELSTMREVVAPLRRLAHLRKGGDRTG